MERSDRERRRAPHTEQRIEAFAHLAGGLVGESDRQNMRGAHANLVDQVGDAIGKDAGLARAWTCEHQHRPTADLHGLPLCLVEILQQVPGHSDFPSVEMDRVPL